MRPESIAVLPVGAESDRTPQFVDDGVSKAESLQQAAEDSRIVVQSPSNSGTLSATEESEKLNTTDSALGRVWKDRSSASFPNSRTVWEGATPSLNSLRIRINSK